MTVSEIENGVLAAITPLDLENARSSQEFAQAQKVINQWFADNNLADVSVYDIGIITHVVHGIRLNQEAFEDIEENMALLGLNEAEKAERWELREVVRQGRNATTQADLTAARARVEDWLARFPGEGYAETWRIGLDTQQFYLDALAGADPSPDAPGQRTLIAA